MATASIEPFLKGETGRNTRGLLRLIILCTIAGAAVASRLFSVISTFPFTSSEVFSVRAMANTSGLQDSRASFMSVSHPLRA